MIEQRQGGEVRVQGRTLTGTVLSYSDLSPEYNERFLPGSLSPVQAVPLLLQHDRALTLLPPDSFVIHDDPDRLHIRAKLPEDSAAIKLTQRGSLNGFSVGFVSEQERNQEGVRIIERAKLQEISLVDQPSYPDSQAEVRQRREPRTWITGGIRYGVVACCQCLPGGTGKVIFHPKALSPRPDVLAVSGRLSETIASSGGGTLAFTQTDQALRFKILDAARETTAGGVIADLIAARAKIYARPLVEPESSTFKDINGVREYEKAVFGGLLIKPINDSADDAREGWDPIKVDGEDGGPKRPRRRSALSWL